MGLESKGEGEDYLNTVLTRFSYFSILRERGFAQIFRGIVVWA